MATLTLIVPDAAMPELIDALCSELPAYRAILPDGSPNPQTRAEFARQRVIQHIKWLVIHYRRQQAQAASDPVEPDIT